ncbi:HlyD family efflux transporter periplasmic adaptor subunit [Pelagibius litoralis]|uniref:HlyD family efflux transporter periplasmic adaptor subunit n=1 Tax=Pelagibius litoralis TaxID=374515 RepID=A0A967F3S1_9PROT|nr:HlyD family efflux transporter periplasmic adaptor subunit [Pelagibius litoralis]NIA72473.1 HlyD family efflux transporter periplasmic adaptor subunit [Pelagibius litoralis]
MVEPSRAMPMKSSRWVYGLAILGFLVYVAWIMGPYLRSVIVRDAAVTSWLNVATSPIDGKLEFKPQAAEGAVGPDGIIVLIRNDRMSRKPLIEAQIQVDYASARVKELQAFLDDIIVLDQDRAALKSRYADIFRSQLEEEIAGMEREINVTRKQLELINRIAARHETLVANGNVSQSATDEIWLRVSELDWQLAQLQNDLAYARVRREAANNGVFATLDGEDPDWVRGERLELKLQKKEGRLELRQAEAALATAKAALRDAETDYARLTEDSVRAPAGSILWNQKAAPGATVRSGEPVAEWLDCSVLMIDVPIADAEVHLIKAGMGAEIILEGDSTVREGRVLLTRGSAFTLGRNDLAALAKGRAKGTAQALLDFSHERENFEDCPVGRAAYVDFPDIGLIDVIRARLRL